MDRVPEEFQSMGFFGIYRESYKVIVSWKKIFSQISFALIFPLTFILFAQIQLSKFLFSEILQNEHQLIYRFPSTRSPTYNRIQSSTTSEWVAFWLFKAVYLIFILVLSLLSTSSVVYTIACIYTSKLQMITFTKVMTVVPKVWKRLMVTSLWYYMILFVYNVLGALVVPMLFIFLIPQQVVLIVILFISLMCYVIGLICLSVVWQLASVVSVLEDISGIKAIIKSKELIKGKMWVVSFTYLAIEICLSVIQRMFVKLAVHNNGTEGGGLMGIGSRVGYGFLCFVLFSVFSLIGLVTQTVIYFVCKSYRPPRKYRQRTLGWRIKWRQCIKGRSWWKDIDAQVESVDETKRRKQLVDFEACANTMS